MSNKSGSILLLESDANTAADIVASISLLDLPVDVSASVAEAKSLLMDRQPLVVLARARVQGDAEAAKRLALEVSRLPSDSRPPVILAATESERHQLASELDQFAGQLKIPVEFPIFTQHVQQLLEELVWSVGGAIGIAAPEVSVASGIPQASIDLERPATRLELLYQVQLEVLKRLTQAGEVDKSEVHGFERRIADETSKVCAEISELLDD